MSKRKTIYEIKEEFRNIHGDKYDYSLITAENYINSETKLPIICHCYDDELEQEHGVFYQDRKHHLRGHGCPKCAKTGIKYTNEEFIKKVKKINKDLLLDKCVYINSQTKIIVGCVKHGYFNIKPYLLLQKHSCPYCAYEKRGFERRTPIEVFIKKARELHGDKYNYSKTKYIKGNKKVCITCPIHGDFWQRTNNHLNGDGCPICRESKLEKEIRKYFNNFKRQQTFEWLKKTNNLYLDFYDEENNIAIECQGEQHFIDKGKFGDFENIIQRDKIKFQLCEEHNIKLIYYFPAEFLKYNVSFYKDKVVFNTITELKEYYDRIK